jgi:hypothetical protein
VEDLVRIARGGLNEVVKTIRRDRARLETVEEKRERLLRRYARPAEPAEAVYAPSIMPGLR